jgi:uncharacterized phage protein (TIGR02220 family)
MWGGSLYGRFEASAVFMVLLSLCDQDGMIDMTPEAIAGTTGWPIDFIQRGISELEAPDERSRTQGEEGRRIIRLDAHRVWGWFITNYKKYREVMRSAERREYLKEKQRERRSKLKASTSVDNVNRVNRNQPIAEARVPNGTMSSKLDEARAIIEFLNEKAGRAYRPTKVNLDFVNARLKEGFTPGECRQVIARKVREWAKDDRFRLYLRPATLFNREKFSQYIGECVVSE